MRYIESENEVIDTKTGLIWMKDPEIDLKFEQAKQYAERISTITGNSWRIPTIGELVSLVDYTLCMPNTPASTFPNMLQNTYWSSSNYWGEANRVWVVNFYDGKIMDYGLGDNVALVLLVR